MPNVLSRVDGYSTLRRAAGHLGPDLVIQLPFGDSGRTTFFVSSESDYARHASAIEGSPEVKIMKRIRCRQAAIEAVVTRRGVVVGPLATQLVGFPELTPHQGGWCGNEIGPGLFAPEVASHALDVTRRFGERLAMAGYRGIFGLDFLQDEATGELILGELNPRITGLTPLTTQVAGDLGCLPLTLWHLLEWSGADYDLDAAAQTDRLRDLSGTRGFSQLIVKQTAPSTGPAAHPPAKGARRLGPGSRARWVRPGFDPAAVASDDEALVVRTLDRGAPRPRGASPTGARLPPSRWASIGSEITAPAGKSPATIACESRALISGARWTRRRGVGGMENPPWHETGLEVEKSTPPRYGRQTTARALLACQAPWPALVHSGDSRDRGLVTRFFMSAASTCRRVAAWVIATIVSATASAPIVAIRAASPADFSHFEAKVRPLLVAHCLQCHAGAKTSGGLALDSREGWQKGGDSGPTIVPGEPAASLLLKAIRSVEGVSSMPPEEDHNGAPIQRLSADEVAVLVEWIQSGAPDPRSAGAKIGGMSREEAQGWWAFQALQRVAVPARADGPAIHNCIDRFLQARLDAAGIAVAAPADRRTLLRRATYDLTGLPPAPEEVNTFLTDPAPDREAFRTVVDRLLQSPQYGVQWGRHWLDVVRYADTAGENTDRPLPHAWRYRNWVYDAFNRDLPWGEFLRLQIAGDILRAGADDAARREGLIATGYLAITRRFGHDIDKDVHLMHEDLIDNLGKNLLGLTTGCARCHDHKYDPVSAEDYYALYGILDGSKFPFPGCEAQGQPRDMVPLLSPAEAEAALAPWKAAVASRDTVLAARIAAGQQPQLKAWLAEQTTAFQAANVGEGTSVPVAAEGGVAHDLKLKKGESIQLTVSPNGNHGADTTLVDLRIECAASADSALVGRRWTTTDLTAGALPANPLVDNAGAAWCFFEPGAAEGPAFLAQRKECVEGKPELVSWVRGELPSAFANTSPNPVKAWTDLPGHTFFVHPAEDRPVAVAWVCPAEGRYLVSGAVADGHPAALDGVSFTLAKVAGVDYGPGLLALGKLAAEPLPEVPPQPALPLAYAVVEGEPHDAPLHQRGDPEKPGAAVPRRWLDILGGEPVAADGGSGRRQLADWIAGSPLATRVIVNRLWQWHFGAGIVRTPNDFGSRGEAPTRPELLEWLAAHFESEGGSLKAFHRLVMDSAAYQRSGTAPGGASALERDPDNKLLGRFVPRRLSAEEIRDSLLVAAGALDPTPAEGHPFPPENTWGFSQHAPFVAVYDSPRRSGYLMVQRQRRHPFLALFDGADPNASTPQRQTTTMPTQALYFLNDPFFHAQAAKVVQRVGAEGEAAAVIGRLYRLLLQREPLPGEVERAQKLLAAYPGGSEEGWGALARVLMASNECVYLD